MGLRSEIDTLYYYLIFITLGTYFLIINIDRLISTIFNPIIVLSLVHNVKLVTQK